MHREARRSQVVIGALLALGAAALPWLAPRLALAGSGAWLCARGLGLAPASALFAAAAHAGSGALLLLGPRGDCTSYPSFAQIGIALAALALVLAWRRNPAPAEGPRWAGAVGVLLALGACFWSARRAASDGEAARWLIVWSAAPVALFALAGWFCESCVLRGRALLQALALLGLLLALRWPESCAFAAGPAALALALVAADGLESAPRAARLLGGAVFALLAALAWSGPGEPAPLLPPEPLDAQDEWVQWHKTSARATELAYVVDVDARVPVEGVTLACVSEADGREVRWTLEREALESGARYTLAPVRLSDLRGLAWSVQLELLGHDGTRIGLRVVDRLVLRAAPRVSTALLGFLGAALLLCAVRGGGARLALAAALLAAAQSVWLYALG